MQTGLKRGGNDMKYIEMRNSINEITSKTMLTDLINACLLDSISKQILKLHYINKMPFKLVADSLHISKSSAERKHRKAICILFKELNK